MVRSLRKARAAVAAAIAALAISGCSAHPGAAAVVNGKEIPEKDIDALAVSIEEAGARVPQRAELVLLKAQLVVTRPVLDQARAVLTEDIKSKMLQACSQQYSFIDPEGGSAEELNEVCYILLLPQVVPQASQSLSARLQDAKIELNPRYGEYTKKSGQWKRSLQPYLSLSEKSAK